MLKMIFLKTNEIEEVIEKTLPPHFECEVTVDEKSGQDIILVKEEKMVCQRLSVNEVFPIINKEHNVEITSYDVFEVGHFGDGFAFNIN